MTEQQRQAAWEAVHRPETSAEDLARIGQMHPEFAQAIAAHPNAAAPAPLLQNSPAPALEPEQAPHEAPSAAPSEQASSAAPQQQWGPGISDQAAWAHAASVPAGVASAGQTPASQPQSGRLNVFGIVALSLQVVHALTTTVTSMAVNSLAMNSGLGSMPMSLLYAGIGVLWALVVGCLGLAGVLQKDAPRMRWTAVSALVTACLGLLTIFASFFSAMFAPVFY